MSQDTIDRVPVTANGLCQRSPSRGRRSGLSVDVESQARCLEYHPSTRSPMRSPSGARRGAFKLDQTYVTLTWIEAYVSVVVVVALLLALLVVLTSRPQESPESSVGLEAVINKVFAAAGKGPVSQAVRDAIAEELAKETFFEVRNVVHARLRGAAGDGG